MFSKSKKQSENRNPRVNRMTVAVRMRPPNKNEKNCNGQIIINSEEGCVTVRGAMIERKFQFDHVFGPEATQLEVYNKIAKKLVEDVPRGINACIIAYGQTGAGKTYTLTELSTEDRYGILPRAIRDLFKILEKEKHIYEYNVKLSYLQIYLEQIQDLLKPENDNLQIREVNYQTIIEGLSEHSVRNLNDVMLLLDFGSRSRHVAQTSYNLHSSRSHTVFIINVERLNIRTHALLKASFTCCDLAGSERPSKSHIDGTLLEEAKFINLSLSSLGNVVSVLAEGKPNKFIPWRDSKLTRILRDKLGGNCSISLIINVGPDESNHQETMTSLLFGKRAMNVTQKVSINLSQGSHVNFMLRQEKEKYHKWYKEATKKNIQLTNALKRTKDKLKQYDKMIEYIAMREFLDYRTFMDKSITTSPEAPIQKTSPEVRVSKNPSPSIIDIKLDTSLNESKDAETKEKDIKDDEPKDKEIKDAETKDEEIKVDEIKDKESKEDETQIKESKDDEIKSEENTLHQLRTELERVKNQLKQTLEMNTVFLQEDESLNQKISELNNAITERNQQFTELNEQYEKVKKSADQANAITETLQEFQILQSPDSKEIQIDSVLCEMLCQIMERERALELLSQRFYSMLQMLNVPEVITPKLRPEFQRLDLLNQAIEKLKIILPEDHFQRLDEQVQPFDLQEEETSMDEFISQIKTKLELFDELQSDLNEKEKQCRMLNEQVYDLNQRLEQVQAFEKEKDQMQDSLDQLTKTLQAQVYFNQEKQTEVEKLKRENELLKLQLQLSTTLELHKSYDQPKTEKSFIANNTSTLSYHSPERTIKVRTIIKPPVETRSPKLMIETLQADKPKEEKKEFEIQIHSMPSQKPKTPTRVEKIEKKGLVSRFEPVSTILSPMSRKSDKSLDQDSMQSSLHTSNLGTLETETSESKSSPIKRASPIKKETPTPSPTLMSMENNLKGIRVHRKEELYPRKPKNEISTPKPKKTIDEEVTVVIKPKSENSTPKLKKSIDEEVAEAIKEWNESRQLLSSPTPQSSIPKHTKRSLNNLKIFTIKQLGKESELKQLQKEFDEIRSEL